MEKVLWLDLEETVITSWDEFLSSPTNIINERKLRKYFKEHNITCINIFSFAIYNDRDKDIFEQKMERDLENILGVEILEFPSVQDLIVDARKSRKIRYSDVSDFLSQNDKFQAYINYCRFNYKQCHNILIDDMVDNWTMTNKDTIIQTININSFRQ